MGFFALRKEQRPYWRRQPTLTQPTVSVDLQLDGAATSSGNLIFVAATPGFFDARMPPHIYEKPHIWRHFPRTMGQPQQIYAFQFTGAASSAGTLDVTHIIFPVPIGVFSPRTAKIPWWRRSPLLAQPTVIAVTHDLVATGAATSAGTLQLDVQVDLRNAGTATSSGSLSLSIVADLRFTGAASSTGSLALSVLVDLTFSGTASSSGALAVEVGGSAAGFFASQGRPGPRLYQLPIWRRQAFLEAGLPPEWLLRGAFVTAGTLQLDVQVDLRFFGAGTSTGTLAVVGVSALQFTGSASSAGTLAVAVTSDLQFSGSYTSVGTLDVGVGGSAAGFFASKGRPGPQFIVRPYWRRQDALPSVAGPYALLGAASSAGSLDLWVTIALAAIGTATSSGTLAVGRVFSDLAASGAATSSGSLDLTVVRDLRLPGAASSTGTLALSVLVDLRSVGTATSSGTLDFRVQVDLRMTGAATSAGTLGLAVLVDLRTVGAATSTGVLALSTLVDLAFLGTSSSLGSITVDWLTPPVGIFGNRPVPQRDYRAFWRRSATFTQASFDYDLRGTASTAGTLDLWQTIDLRATGAATSAGTLALGIVTPLQANGAASSAGSLALSVVVDLRFFGAATTAGTLAVTQQLALIASGAATSSGTLALSVIVDLRTIGTATSAGTLTVGIPAMMVATGAATSAGSLALTVLLDLRASGASISLGGLLLDLFTPTPGIFANRPGPRYFARPYWRRQALLDGGGDTHPWQGAGGGISSGSLDLTIILSPAGIGKPAAEPVFTWDPVLHGYQIGRRTRGKESPGRAGRSPQGRR